MPRTAKPKSKRPSGAYRARVARMALLQAWTSPENAEKIRAAAIADGRPLSQFIVHYALTQAEIILRKKGL